MSERHSDYLYLSSTSMILVSNQSPLLAVFTPPLYHPRTPASGGVISHTVRICYAVVHEYISTRKSVSLINAIKFSYTASN
jgi:hypothetical protein